MVHISAAKRTSETGLFLDAAEVAGRLGLRKGAAEFLLRHQVIPTYQLDGREVVLRQDLWRVMNPRGQVQSPPIGHLPGLAPESLSVGENLLLELPQRVVSGEPWEESVFSPAIANLIDARLSRAGSEEMSDHRYFCGTTLRGPSPQLDAVLRAQLDRILLAQSLEDAPIARGTKYFGTKRRLAPFLVEAVRAHAGPDTAILDLMTGSGAASAALSQHWQTWASDAQEFSGILARVQGAGFSEREAAAALSRIAERTQENASQLTARVESFVAEEARIFAMRSNEEARSAYARLMDAFPTLGNQGVGPSWNPRQEVDDRRHKPDLFPYCLFLAYFANTYFGIRQAIEIDSIRWGISGLPDGSAKTWALGALIAAVSDLNTGFGGHFAQPRSHPRELSHRQLMDLMSRRRLSVSDEFHGRLMLLGRESESQTAEICVLPGPWQTALDAFSTEAAGRSVIVYFDPPYRREEYSRYYHALETLVAYGYPSVTGSGLVPDKKLGERFSSEFFSRSETTLIEVITRVIRQIVSRGWTCCWSYSDQAAVPPAKVIEVLLAEKDLEISSFGAPYRHRGHGRSAQLRPVTEYLIVVKPKS
jgi:adenine-specific DNA-methyltransferase